ncbi:MAG TPA: hypothetical protein VGC79_07670 [Polyangiaceae bacterium]
MLVPKPRHAFGLTFLGAIFLLQLSSCDSGSEGAAAGSSGSSSSVAGARPASGGSSGTGVAVSGGPSVAGASGASVSAGGLSSGGVGGQSDGGGGTGGMAPPCTDIQNPDHPGEPCSIWPDYDAAKGTTENCDASWLTGAGYCLQSCGKCRPAGSGGSGGGSAGGFSTGLGPGPALPDVKNDKVY